MPTSSVAGAINDAIKALVKNNAIQRIRSISITPGPTSVDISFKTSQKTGAMVQLFETASMSSPFRTGLEILTQSTTHPFSFRGLDQKTKYFFRITAGGKGGNAIRTGTFVTGSRAAEVLFQWLHVRNDGDPAASGEMRFFVSICDNGTDTLVAPDLRYPANGLADISSGDEVWYPWGTQPVRIEPAPDELALYADGLDDDMLTMPWDDFLEPPRQYIKTFPYHVEYSTYAAAGAVTVAKLPDAVGDSQQDVVLDSGNWAIAFSFNATIRTIVTAPTEAPKLNVKEEIFSIYVEDTPPLMHAKGGKQDDFVALGPDGDIYARAADPLKGEHRQQEWRRVGGDHLETFTLVDSVPGSLHIFGRRVDGKVVHTAADERKGIPLGREWTELGGNASGHITAIRTNDAQIDLFVVDRDGGACHATVSTKGRPRAGAWQSLGGNFDSVTAVCVRNGALHVFGRGRDGSVHGRVLTGAKDRKTEPQWTDLGGSFNGPLVAGLSADGDMSLVGFGTDRSAHVKVWTGRGWTPPAREWTRVRNIDILDATDDTNGKRGRKGSPGR